MYFPLFRRYRNPFFPWIDFWSLTGPRRSLSHPLLFRSCNSIWIMGWFRGWSIPLSYCVGWSLQGTTIENPIGDISYSCTPRFNPSFRWRSGSPLKIWLNSPIILHILVSSFNLIRIRYCLRVSSMTPYPYPGIRGVYNLSHSSHRLDLSTLICSVCQREGRREGGGKREIMESTHRRERGDWCILTWRDVKERLVERERPIS